MAATTARERVWASAKPWPGALWGSAWEPVTGAMMVWASEQESEETLGGGLAGVLPTSVQGSPRPALATTRMLTRRKKGPSSGD